MYLDTNSGADDRLADLRVSLRHTTQSVDQGQLKAITNTILQILATAIPTAGPLPGPLARRADRRFRPAAAEQPVHVRRGDDRRAESPRPALRSQPPPLRYDLGSGTSLTNLSASVSSPTPRISGIAAQQSVDTLQTQQAAARPRRHQEPRAADPVDCRHHAEAKPMRAGDRSLCPPVPIHLRLLRLQPGHRRSLHHRAGRLRSGDSRPAAQSHREPNLRSLLRPRGLPQHAHLLQHVDHRARPWCRTSTATRPSRDAAYQNVLSKTDELSLGYMYSLYDSSNNFDNLDFQPLPGHYSSASAQVAELHLHEHSLLHPADGAVQARHPLRSLLAPSFGSGRLLPTLTRHESRGSCDASASTGSHIHLRPHRRLTSSAAARTGTRTAT